MPGDRPTELARQEVDQDRAEAFGPRRFAPHTVVGNQDLQGRPLRRDPHQEMSLAALRERMFHGIADEFIQEQGEGDGLGTRQHELLDIERQPHLPAREQVENVCREFRYESDEVEPAAIRRVRHQALNVVRALIRSVRL